MGAEAEQVGTEQEAQVPKEVWEVQEEEVTYTSMITGIRRTLDGYRIPRTSLGVWS